LVCNHQALTLLY